jgi:hypothetical protein
MRINYFDMYFYDNLFLYFFNNTTDLKCKIFLRIVFILFIRLSIFIHICYFFTCILLIILSLFLHITINTMIKQINSLLEDKFIETTLTNNKLSTTTNFF